MSARAAQQTESRKRQAVTSRTSTSHAAAALRKAEIPGIGRRKTKSAAAPGVGAARFSRPVMPVRGSIAEPIRTRPGLEVVPGVRASSRCPSSFP